MPQETYRIVAYRSGQEIVARCLELDREGIGSKLDHAVTDAINQCGAYLKDCIEQKVSPYVPVGERFWQLINLGDEHRTIEPPEIETILLKNGKPLTVRFRIYDRTHQTMLEE